MDGAAPAGGAHTGSTPPAAVLSGQRLVVPGSWHQRGDTVIEFEDLYLTEFVRPVLDVSDLAPPWHRRSDPTGEPAPGSVAPPVPARPSGRAVLGVAAMTVAVVLTGLGNRPAANPGPTTGMLLESSFAQLVPSFTSPCVASALTSIDATRSPVCAAALAAHARALEFDPLR